MAVCNAHNTCVELAFDFRTAKNECYMYATVRSKTCSVCTIYSIPRYLIVSAHNKSFIKNNFIVFRYILHTFIMHKMELWLKQQLYHTKD